MDVYRAIQTKRAVREFASQPLPDETISRILNAGRRAQSAKNSQPWEFIAVTDRQVLKSLSGMGTWAGHLAGAALGVVFLSPPYTGRFSIAFDLGQAASYMQLAAWDVNIGSCLATIYETEQARQLLGFPDELETHLAISFGYPADEATITRPPKQGGRKPLEQTVHWNHW